MIATLLIAYLLGSIPFGLLLTRAAGMGDIRKVGSGNIGATNVMRTGNKKLGIATLLCDGLKGVAAVMIARGYVPEAAPYAAIIVVLGHIFPVWLKFKGGKGVATYIGAMLALTPAVGAAIIAGWLAVFAITRTSSLSALISIGLSPLTAWLLTPEYALVALLLAALIFYTHRSNIRRLIAGEEGRFGKRRS